MLTIVLTPTPCALAVVVGAGTVGIRRCGLLQAAGWRVRIVDPIIKRIPRNVDIVATEYQIEVLEQAKIVVVCTNKEDVNARVVADALNLGLLVCDATNPKRGNFVFPATWTNDCIQLSLSTGGASPSLANRLVRQLGESLPASINEYIQLLQELRSILIDKVADDTTRRALLHYIASQECQNRVEQEGTEPIKQEILSKINIS